METAAVATEPQTQTETPTVAGFRTEVWPLSRLTANPKNYRRHPESQLAVLRESLRVHGLQKPVVVQADGTILAGHGLVLAAAEEGWTEIPVRIYDGPNPEAFLVIDNHSAELAEDNGEVLLMLLREQDAAGNLLATGYDAAALAELIAEVNAANPQEETFDADAAMAAAEKAAGPTRVQPGEVWQLGRHRVMCGDSGHAEDIDVLLAGQTLNLIVTSPPYAEQRKEQYGGVPADEYGAWFLPMAALWKVRLAEDGSFFLNIKEHCEDGERHLYVKKLVIALREEGGWKFIDELCWQRTALPGIFGPRFKNQWEPVFHFSVAEPKFRSKAVLLDRDLSGALTYDETDGTCTLGPDYGGHGKGNVRSKYFDGALPGNVLRCSKEQGVGHGAQFPIRLPQFFLQAYSDVGDRVIDPFLGSGTTLIAAEKLGRICYGMEIEPRYCDVALARWEQFTGQTAEREVNGTRGEGT